VSVDAGIVWIGDPCYILHKKASETPKAIGKNWSEFCEKLGSENIITFEHDKGHEGLGVAVSSGYGDGFYPVVADIVDTGEFGERIKSVTVKFF